MIVCYDAHYVYDVYATRGVYVAHEVHEVFALHCVDDVYNVCLVFVHMM